MFTPFNEPWMKAFMGFLADNDEFVCSNPLLTMYPEDKTISFGLQVF
jgi:hypothetical protein